MEGVKRNCAQVSYHESPIRNVYKHISLCNIHHNASSAIILFQVYCALMFTF